MKYLVQIAGRTVEVVVEGASVAVEGRSVEAHLAGVGATPVHHLLLGGRSYEVVASRGDGPGGGGGRWRLVVGGDRFDVSVVDERAEAVRAILGRAAPPPAAGGVVVAPMPGLVVRVSVEAGQRVTPGTGLVVVEAMKMENELRAAAGGTVRRVLVSPGVAVEKGQPLVELESEG